MSLIGAGAAIATVGMSIGTLITTGVAFGIEALALKGNKILNTMHNQNPSAQKVAHFALLALAAIGAIIGTSFAVAGSLVGIAIIAIAKKPDSLIKGIVAVVGSVALTSLIIYGHYKAFQWSMR